MQTINNDLLNGPRRSVVGHPSDQDAVAPDRTQLFWIDTDAQPGEHGFTTVSRQQNGG